MANGFHPSSDELYLYADSELGGDDLRRVETHLRRCAECSRHLENWRAGVDLYRAYHADFLKPRFDGDLPDWKTVRGDTRRQAHGRAGRLWWTAGAVTAALLLAGVYLRWERSKSAEMGALLTAAESSRQTSARALRFDMGARVWVRDENGRSQEDTAEHVRSLFMQARYDWERPLDVRSFSAWRRGLEAKRDDVLLIRNARGEKYAYRVRTQTPRGLLRAVSLTLRSDNYRTTAGSFQFEGEDRLDISEDVETPHLSKQEKKKAQRTDLRAVPVGPEEELRVLAALNRIGADVEDAVSVRMDRDRGRVVVIGMGLPEERQRRITAALANEPAAAVRFETGLNANGAARRAGRNQEVSGGGDYRRQLEMEAGGAEKWQAMSDSALAETAAILARAHALLRLQQEFPPRVEAQLSPEGRQTLAALVTAHQQAIISATTSLKAALNSVMNFAGTSESGARTWQERAVHLYEQARLLDEDANRFLIDDYDEEAGRQLRESMGVHLRRVDYLAERGLKTDSQSRTTGSNRPVR